MAGYCPHCGETIDLQSIIYADNSFREEVSDLQSTLDALGDESPEGPDGDSTSQSDDPVVDPVEW